MNPITNLAALGAQLEALLSIIGATRTLPKDTSVHVKISMDYRVAGLDIPVSALRPILSARYDELRTAIDKELAE